MHPYLQPHYPPLTEKFNLLESSYDGALSFIGSSKKIKINQFMVLFKNAQIFIIFMTFFVSTSLWVFIEPILSLYLIK